MEIQIKIPKGLPQVNGTKVLNVLLKKTYCETKQTYKKKQKKTNLKGELRSKISLLHMKVLTLIKAKSNVFL